VLFGAVLTSEDSAITVGARTEVMKNVSGCSVW